MKRWLGIIAIIVLIFTACGDDNDEGANSINFSDLYGKWSNPSSSTLTRIFIISESEIEHYLKFSFENEPSLQYKCGIQTIEKYTNTIGLHKNEYPEGFKVVSLIIEDGDPTDEFYSVDTSWTNYFYLNGNKDRMENSSNIYIKTVD